jgi:hypothetical protein
MWERFVTEEGTSGDVRKGNKRVATVRLIHLKPSRLVGNTVYLNVHLTTTSCL